MKKRLNVALVAHDARKKDLIDWVVFNFPRLANHNLICTGTTGGLVEKAFDSQEPEDRPPSITKLKSGPLGGDQQLGSRIAEGQIDVFFFFWDTMSPQPHDVDVKALLRLATMYNVPTACNRSTADFLITSPLFGTDYQRKSLDFTDYTQRKL